MFNRYTSVDNYSCAYIHRLLYNITMTYQYYVITYLATIIIIRYILYSDTLIRRSKKFSYILLTVYVRTYHVATVSKLYTIEIYIFYSKS